MQIIARNVLPNGQVWAAQNPTAVLDKTDPEYPDGKVILIYTANEHEIWGNMKGNGIRRFITAWSGDHGHTWNWDKINSPAGTHDGDITNQVFYPYDPDYTAVYSSDYAAANYNNSGQNWTFGHPTTGHSIQLSRKNSTRDRLLITGTYSNYVADPGFGDFNFFNWVFWSDDHGKTWEIGGTVDSPTYHMNEVISVELENGDVLINSRGYRGISKAGRVLVRASFDKDGKVSFGIPWRETTLGALDTAIGMARITTTDQPVFGSKSRIAYSGPNDLANRQNSSRNACRRRSCFNFWMSTDEGAKWDAYGEIPKYLHEGPSGYSDIVALPDARVGVIYEGSFTHTISRGGGFLYTSASLDWLSDGADQRALVRHDTSSMTFNGSAGVDLSGLIDDVADMSEGSAVMTFKTTRAEGTQTLFSVSDSGDADSLWSLAQTPDGRFGVLASNDSVDVNTTAFDRNLVTDGLWHRIAVTVGADGTHIYVDGQHVAHGESTSFFGDINDLDAMDIGRTVLSNSAGHFWNGSIGTVEIFDGVLTAEQAVAATQPAAMPVAAWHVDRDLTADNAITLATAPGGTDLVADHLPQWVCNELAASWAIGTTFTAPDSVTDQATVFHSEDSVPLGDGSQLSIASLMLGIWDTDDGKRIGLRYDGPVLSEWNLSVPFDVYSGQKVSMIAVMGPVNSYLIINGETVATTPTPVPEGPPVWNPAKTTIGTTNTDHALGTNLKTLAIWKGVVPSTHLAESLTLAHNITR